MRRKFKELLIREMRDNDRIVVMTADIGYKIFDDIINEFPGRFFNVGSAEQLAMGMSVGMAIAGKIPVFYSITTFLLYRPFEWIRNYLQYDNIPVKLVGAGRDQDYAHYGVTHYAHDDFRVMELFSNIHSWWPESPEEVEAKFYEFLFNGKPSYLNLKR